MADSPIDFLTRASQYLASSLDYETTLLNVAGLALPYLGSWCIVDVVEADGSMRRIGIVHPDPLKQEYADRLRAGWPPDRDDPLGAPRAVRSGVTEFIPHVSDEMLVEVARGEGNLRDLRGLGIGSVVVVPLASRTHVLGAISFVSADGQHHYSDADVKLAEDLGVRCAIALDNARLFSDLEVAREAMQTARDRAAQLNERLVLASVRQQELADEAREAARAKSQFLATVSHEIRTPINAIVGYADLLEMEIAGPITDKQREFLARQKASSTHLIGLIDDILDLAKVESGRMHVRQETLAAEEAVTTALTLIEPQARMGGVTVTTDCSGGRNFYSGDGDRVRQILAILLSNAVKFTDRGGDVTVRCGVARVPDPGSRVDASDGPWTVIQVEDTGIGISAEAAEAVFEPFVQVDFGNTRKLGGAGLGLAIALELARRMGGDLTLRSEPGAGSTFTLWLPWAAPPAE